jgi:hypothetical protein
MVHLTMTPDVSSIRAYDRSDGYEKRLPYLAIVQVKHLDDTTVYLGGAVGTVNRETWEAVLDLLRAQGVTTVMLHRHRKMKTIELQNRGSTEEPNNHTARAA